MCGKILEFATLVRNTSHKKTERVQRRAIEIILKFQIVEYGGIKLTDSKLTVHVRNIRGECRKVTYTTNDNELCRNREIRTDLQPPGRLVHQVSIDKAYNG